MEQISDSQPRPRRVDQAAKLAFLDALRDGLPRDEAAAAAGFTATSFYNARDADPLFRRAWRWALELSAIDGRALRAEPHPDSTITPTGGRALQRRHVRRRVFDDRRKQIFLDRFAGSADAHEAAEAAGVSYSAVLAHFRKDADFAAAWEEALAIAYAQLEAEAVRQRLAAQGRFRGTLAPEGEVTKEFERVMQLLARYRRPDGRIALRSVGAGREQRWSFDDAIRALDKKLRALGLRTGVTPPEEEPPAGEAGDPAP